MIDNPDTAAALLSVFVSALTQVGIPAVFIVAWWQERQAHQSTTDNYIRDLRAICKVKPAAKDASDTPPAAPQ